MDLSIHTFKSPKYTRFCHFYVAHNTKNFALWFCMFVGCIIGYIQIFVSDFFLKIVNIVFEFVKIKGSIFSWLTLYGLCAVSQVQILVSIPGPRRRHGHRHRQWRRSGIHILPPSATRLCDACTRPGICQMCGSMQVLLTANANLGVAKSDDDELQQGISHATWFCALTWDMLDQSL